MTQVRDEFSVLTIFLGDVAEKPKGVGVRVGMGVLVWIKCQVGAIKRGGVSLRLAFPTDQIFEKRRRVF